MERARILTTAADADRYVPLASPDGAAALRWVGRDPSVVAVGAAFLGQPVGLAVARAGQGAGRVHSLYVLPPVRRQGIGTALLTGTEDALRERGCGRATLIYAVPDQSPRAAVERFLAGRGWGGARLRWLHLETSLDRITRAPWLARATLPPGFAIVPWFEVTDADRADIARRQRDAPWIPPELEPARWEAGCEPGTSLALRDDGAAVVGWMLCHAMDAATLRYSNGWVRQDLRRVGHAVPFVALLAEAIRRTGPAGFQRGMYAVSVHQAPMLAFLRRHLAPFATQMREAWEVEKRLG